MRTDVSIAVELVGGIVCAQPSCAASARDQQGFTINPSVLLSSRSRPREMSLAAIGLDRQVASSLRSSRSQYCLCSGFSSSSSLLRKRRYCMPKCFLFQKADGVRLAKHA